MGLLDDLDELIGSQKTKFVVQSQEQQLRTGPTSKGSSDQQQQQHQHQTKEKAGYETWSLFSLQEEAKRYGFRPSQDRKSLVKQLNQVQEALENQQEIGDVSLSSSSFLHSCSSMELLSDDDNEAPMSDLTREIMREAATAPNLNSVEDLSSEASVADADEEEEGEEGEDDIRDTLDDRIAPPQSQMSASSPTAIAPTLSSQLYKAITSNKSLYHRILLFEPVSFDEVSSTAKRAGVTGLKSKEILRNWLDMQGICFYSAELTGQRQRY